MASVKKRPSRRKFLEQLAGPSKRTVVSGSSGVMIKTTLDPYTGPWNFSTIKHLLSRTTFGISTGEFLKLEPSNLEDTIELLFEDIPLPPEPINYNFERDIIPIGESWVDSLLPGDIPGLRAARERSLRTWNIDLLIRSEMNIREKLTLFWHNHFATQISIYRDPNFAYKYINTLRANALGNFKTLVEQITIDPAMLHYLNGHQNRKNSPNENYARELLELFTIGKGPLAGPNDYTHYTEDDVVAASKVLTGWRYMGYFGRDGNPAGSRFVPSQHNTEDKQFSHRFNNHVIQNSGEREYLDLIDMIFSQEEVSRFICRKLYRWFVNYEIDQQIETDVIIPLSEILRANNYEIKPALKALLSSEHFFDDCNKGIMIKNPIDFIIKEINELEVGLPDPDLVQNGIYPRFEILGQLERIGVNQDEMVYFEPPNVAGWKAYYQQPLYYKSWISSVTLTQRQQISTAIISGVRVGPFTVKADLLKYISQLNDPFDPNTLILDISAHLLSYPVTEHQKDLLKEILIPGLPDFEWTVEYGEHLLDPEDENLKRSVESKLMALFSTLLGLPEYYMS